MRSFRAEWCEKTAGSIIQCSILLHMYEGKLDKFLASTKRDPLSKGFKNWKDATIAFNAHLRSDCHKEGCEILELRSTTNDVAENLKVQGRE